VIRFEGALMKQVSLVAGSGFAKQGRVTKRAMFLSEMNRVVPWKALCQVRIVKCERRSNLVSES
jgi:hypothetical protein